MEAVTGMDSAACGVGGSVCGTMVGRTDGAADPLAEDVSVVAGEVVMLVSGRAGRVVLLGGVGVSEVVTPQATATAPRATARVRAARRTRRPTAWNGNRAPQSVSHRRKDGIIAQSERCDCKGFTDVRRAVRCAAEHTVATFRATGLIVREEVGESSRTCGCVTKRRHHSGAPG